MHDNETLHDKLKTAEYQAITSLAGYKFIMFGYHAAVWVTVNQLLPREEQKGNPFQRFVKLARDIKYNEENKRQSTFGLKTKKVYHDRHGIHRPKAPRGNKGSQR